ncbi:MAG TPA: phosphodiester glycosidase family protein [Nocardioidaceae bacterium]|nr:phosphodiester glycosidase family protein [Nocardioidaceae bacterium]
MHPRRTGIRRAARAVALTTALATGLGLGPTTTASATDGTPPAPVEQDAPRHSSDLREATVAAPRVGTSASFTVDQDTVPVAPGLDLTSFDRYDARGWIRVDALRARLSTPGLKLRYLSPGKVTSRAPLSRSLQRAHGVAGVNADFFDITDTGAPRGVGVDRRHGLLHAPASDWNHTFSVDKRGVATIARSFLEARVVRTGRRAIPVSNLNSPTLAPGGVGIYTHLWGATSRARVIPGSGKTRAVVVRGGRVRDKRVHLRAGAIPRGTTLLVGHGAGARKLGQLRRGQRVGVEYGLDRDAVVAVGGSDFLVQRGKVVAPADPAMHPRTAVGIDRDSGEVLIVTVDGRQATSRGLTLRETGALMRQLGAETALNLDGGGSSTMLARESGEPVQVVNSPSDGHLRSVPNGLGFSFAKGSGRLRGLRLEPAADLPDSHRVLRGLSRVLVARGHDESYAPVRARPRWDGSARVKAPGGRRTKAIVVGTRTGAGTVTARAGGVRGRFTLHVLGRVHRLETSVASLALPGRGSRGSFEVRGYDARGFGTWIAPRDVQLHYDHDKLRVRRTGRGLTVTALKRSTSDAVRVRVGGRTTYVGVTAGLARDLVHRLNGRAGWEVSARPKRSDAALRLVRARKGRAGKALALRYTLRGAGERSAYLSATTPIRLPARARRIGLWVRGDGHGGWLRMNLADASGARATVNLASRVTWKGWRFLTVAVPAELAQPLSLREVYLVQTRHQKRYAGTVAFDDLTVFTERVPHVPQTPLPRDPMVVDDPTGDDGAGRGGLRVAVVADAEIVGGHPRSGAVQRLRRVLREAVAARPDLVLVNGDLVGRSRARDFALAERVLDQELGEVPWRYLPGDDEVNAGTLSHYRARFGPPVRTVDRAGTRFVLLNSSRGTFRLGGFGQLVQLRRQLDRAAKDASIRSVVVVAHHPTSDPDAGGNAEITDPREGALVEDLLAGFRADSGKQVAYVGAHARQFGLSRTDDVPHVLAGPVNAAARGDGGFAGWTLLRIGADEEPWLRAEFRPLADAVTVRAPARLAPGSSRAVSVSVRQPQRRVRAGYPMPVAWVSSRTLYVGRPGAAPSAAVAAYNPRTGTLTALRTGHTRLKVRVNGVEAVHDLNVT